MGNGLFNNRLRKGNLISQLSHGVLVAADQNVEWLLPWWWDRYRAHNSTPVAFVDLGMTLAKKQWCRKRGIYLPLRMLDFAEEPCWIDLISWREEGGSSFSSSRNGWFKKPHACLLSPFGKTLWLDLDCEVRKDLSSLFLLSSHFLIAKDPLNAASPYPVYNTGVFLFSKEHPILKLWAEKAVSQNALFRGDQELLSYLLADHRIEVEELPSLYNWSRCHAFPKEAAVIHWHDPQGKLAIRLQINQFDESR